MDEFTIEAQAMRLANRAYAYRVFHIAFGAEPSSDELRVLASPETVEAFRFLAETAREEGSGEGAQTLTAAADLLALLGAHAEDAAGVASLKASFTRLFLVPGASFVHPWESPYIGKEVMLFQESTLDVRHRYAAYGFAAAEFGRFPEDHVSMMLDFLAHLSSAAFEAFGDGNDEEAGRILADQRAFVAAHLDTWLPAFVEKLCEQDAEGTYARLACALRAFVELDKALMDAWAGACPSPAR